MRDSLKVLDSDNVVIDHVSISWGRDENAEVYNTIGEVDFRHVLFSEGLKKRDPGHNHPHSWGMLIGRFPNLRRRQCDAALERQRSVVGGHGIEGF